MRRTPLLLVTGLALAATAACSESATTRLMAPEASVSASKSAGDNSGSAPRAGATSTGGVRPVVRAGNTHGEGGSACSALGYGSVGMKVDGAFSRQIAGYQFTVSDGGTTLSFAPVAGTSPTSTILAVIVKGGNAFDIYEYRGTGKTADGGLTSPYNNGGNIAGISHYVVCYGPGAPVRPPVFSKKLIDVLIINSAGAMVTDPVYLATGQVVIPAGETRWVDYEITYTLPDGSTGTVTENEAAICSTMGTGVNVNGSGMIGCSINYGMAQPSGSWSSGVLTWSNLTKSGRLIAPIDIVNGGLVCGKRDFTNTAVLTVGGKTYEAKATTTFHFTIPGKVC